MSDENIQLEERYKNFLATICETQKVYGLESNDGFATSDSNDYTDENGEPVEILCFWSKKALAEKSANNDWADFTAIEIPLNEFIENWCVGMSNDALLIGTDFDENLAGLEIEPLELVLEIIQELKDLQKELVFQNFENLEDIENQIMEILKDSEE